MFSGVDDFSRLQNAGVSATLTGDANPGSYTGICNYFQLRAWVRARRWSREGGGDFDRIKKGWRDGPRGWDIDGKGWQRMRS